MVLAYNIKYPMKIRTENLKSKWYSTDHRSSSLKLMFCVHFDYFSSVFLSALTNVPTIYPWNVLNYTFSNQFTSANVVATCSIANRLLRQYRFRKSSQLSCSFVRSFQSHFFFRWFTVWHHEFCVIKLTYSSVSFGQILHKTWKRDSSNLCEKKYERDTKINQATVQNRVFNKHWRAYKCLTNTTKHKLLMISNLSHLRCTDYGRCTVQSRWILVCYVCVCVCEIILITHRPCNSTTTKT